MGDLFGNETWGIFPHTPWDLSPWPQTDSRRKAIPSDRTRAGALEEPGANESPRPVRTRTSARASMFPSMALAADHDSPSYKVVYDGGSVGGLKAGTELKMYIDQTQVRFFHGKELITTVPAAAITEVSYGQDVHRRVGTAIAVATVSLGVGALLALTKSKKHYVGLTWATGDQKGGLAMQCDKGEYRGILTGLSGISGKPVVDSDSLTVKN